ncbi:S-adenosyl-L-methionine-dependent methyltransferase [Circinella umbellata]|nr:S-adenosyl-L-methionine-dependent methyltransferase [Circinella umbellata]
MTTETQRKLLFQLVKLFRCSRILEIGTFTGAATIAMAAAMSSSPSSLSSGKNGDNGKLITLEMDPKAAGLAQKHAKKLKYLDDRIDFIIGPAMESLVRIIKERPNEQYDLVFIDANKDGYASYFDFIMDNNLLSDNGVIIADNVLFYGQVHRHAGYDDITPFKFRADSPDTAAKIHDFNQHVSMDKRAEVVILPIFDGLSIITKRKQTFNK